MSKKILFITGTRADFGKLEPLAKELVKNRHSVTFFITGMHMLSRYGETKYEVRKCKGCEFHEYINQRPGDQHDAILAKTVIGLSDWITEHDPDLVVIHGDRIEALASSIVCATNGVPSAHIEGGEVSGTIDEMYRHCVTKLSRHHFVSSQDAKRRVKMLGEDPDSIYVIGSPELDVHLSGEVVPIDMVKQHYGIDYDEFGIVVFHPVTTEKDSMHAQATSLFDALQESGKKFIVISPNNDPGSEAIFKTLETLPKPQFKIIPSMRFAYFSSLMKSASCIVGNSSIGVREAPFLGMPSLNVGTRQNNRSNDASITNVEATNKNAILGALTLNWNKRYVQSKRFGTGQAAKLFAEILDGDEFWTRAEQKSFVDPD